MNPISDSGPWSLGTLIALPVFLLIVIGILIYSQMLYAEAAMTQEELLARDGYAYRNHRKDHLWLARGCVLAAILMLALIASPAGMYPYDTDYHQWKTVSGPVEQVDKRLVSGGKSMQERYVFLIGGQPFGVDDTRAATVKVGDTVKLSCKKEWQYAATPGWGCRWKS